MPVADFYPSAVVSQNTFTNAEVQKLVGNNTNVATHTGALAVNAGMGAVFRYNLSAIPSNAVVNRLEAWFLARASAAGCRSTLQYDCYSASTGGSLVLLNLRQALGTADAWQAIGVDNPSTNLLAGWLKADAEHTWTIVSDNTSTTTTYWTQAMLRITWTVPVSKAGLFFGTDF